MFPGNGARFILYFQYNHHNHSFKITTLLNQLAVTKISLQNLIDSRKIWLIEDIYKTYKEFKFKM